jgi:hypothetical protein
MPWIFAIFLKVLQMYFASYEEKRSTIGELVCGQKERIKHHVLNFMMIQKRAKSNVTAFKSC